MSEEFKYGTAENMSENNYLSQGGHLVASVYLFNKSVGIDFNEENVKLLDQYMLNVGKVLCNLLCNLLLLLPLIVYILHDWSFLTCTVIFKLKLH